MKNIVKVASQTSRGFCFLLFCKLTGRDPQQVLKERLDAVIAKLQEVNEFPMDEVRNRINTLNSRLQANAN